jgi:hypothetical protein
MKRIFVVEVGLDLVQENTLTIIKASTSV